MLPLFSVSKTEAGRAGTAIALSQGDSPAHARGSEVLVTLQIILAWVWGTPFTPAARQRHRGLTTVLVLLWGHPKVGDPPTSRPAAAPVPAGTGMLGE